MLSSKNSLICIHGFKFCYVILTIEFRHTVKEFEVLLINSVKEFEVLLINSVKLFQVLLCMTNNSIKYQ